MADREVTLTMLSPLPPQEVFRFISNTENNATWVAGMQRVRKQGTDPIGVGTTFRFDLRWLLWTFQGAVRVTEMDFPSRYAYETIEGFLAFSIRYLFESVPEGTRLTLHIRPGKRGRVARLAGPLWARGVRRQYTANLRALGRQLDAYHSGAPLPAADTP